MYYSVISDCEKDGQRYYEYGVCESIEDAEFLFEDVKEMSEGKLKNLRVVEGIVFKWR